jgi:hypothetical protein
MPDCHREKTLFFLLEIRPSLWDMAILKGDLSDGKDRICGILARWG